MTVRRLRRELPAQELVDWQAYARYRSAEHERASKRKQQLVETW